MADIFVSYARADKERVAPLVSALEAQGYSVWWDPAIAGGQEFDAAITKELEAARAAIVVWTEASVSSRWVRGEARIAADRGVLVPVQFGAPALPIDARALHTIDFDTWNGDTTGAPFQELIRSLKSLDQSAPAPTGPAPERTAQPSIAASPQHKGIWQQLKPWHFGALTVAVLAAIGLAIFAGRGAQNHESKAPASTVSPPITSSASVSQPAKPRLAVMPFENLSPDPANAFFTDGMHEEILTALANSAPGLEVISRTTMMTYKDHPASVERIAKDLGVTHVIEGSVRREGDEVRVTLQLIDAKTDEHIWAQNYDRKLIKAMTLQSEVAGEVAKQLAVKLAGPAAPQLPTSSPQAYDLYLESRLLSDSLNSASSEQERERPLKILNRAIAIDPNFGKAYLERALQRLRQGDVGDPLAVDNEEERQAKLKQARADVARARQLLGDTASVLATFAYITGVEDQFDPTRALLAFTAAEAAGQIDPPWLSAGHAYMLLYSGRSQEALPILKHLAELDPENQTALQGYALALIFTQRFAEAMRVRDTVVERFPGPDSRLSRATTAFDVTGVIANLSATVEREAPALEPHFALGFRCFILLYERKFAELSASLDASSLDVARGGLPWSSTPVAELRGEAALLSGDPVAAAKAGAALRDFLKHIKVTPFNRPIILALTAESELMSGDKAGALATAQQAAGQVSRTRNLVTWSRVSTLVAIVYAWAGSKDESAELLEAWASIASPANVVRNPLYDIPLADNARYQALKTKLEAEMAANAKLLDVAGP